MIEEEYSKIESELNRVKPAPVPPVLMERLRSSSGVAQATTQADPAQPLRLVNLLLRFRWLAAAAPVVIALVFYLRLESQPARVPAKNISVVSPAGIKADTVEVDHSLVSTFDAVAQLPGGEPVRFRCRKWKDELVMEDKSRGVVISQSNPRVEVVPVRFETY